MKGLVVAGTKSGSGKTTIALGLMAALVKRGLKVAPFKVGPDFIDPGHHTRITGRTSRNLDGWMLSEAYNRTCFRRHGQGADMAVVEGVMGLFDGYDGKSEAGSTAQMAKWLDLPVLLVVDAKSMARSAAALVQGFERFDRELKFAGVLFNRVGSARHLAYLQEALADHVNMACLGGIRQAAEIAIPERHLGLVTPEDHPLSGADSAKLAGIIENNLDLERLLVSLADAAPPTQPAIEAQTGAGGPAVKIGVARDRAFCFYYQDNLDLLAAAGAELIFFSPLTDRELPADLDGIYLGGGYPELHAERLARNESMRRHIKARGQNGMPIYGECGGFMYLCRELSVADGTRFPMAGCFDITTRMFPRLRSLGYREITLARDTVIAEQGRRVRGHEFHYSEITELPREAPAIYHVSARSGLQRPPEGYQSARCLGSYIHLHFGSQPAVADRFTRLCRIYQRERRERNETI